MSRLRTYDSESVLQKPRLEWPTSSTREATMARSTTAANAQTSFLLIRLSYRIVFRCLGVLLVVASLLKSHQLATAPLPPTEWLPPTALSLVVQFELLIGILLVFDVAPRLLWWISMVLFASFALASLQKALLGYDSCGCFGNLEISPWWTLTIDLAAVVALVIWCPPLRQSTRRESLSRRWFVAVLIYTAVGMPLGIAMAQFEAKRLTSGMQLLDGGDIVLLEPKTWISDELPLIPYIDRGEALRTGNWTVLLFHHDCPKCQEIIPFYEAMASASHNSSNHIGLIELPPIGWPTRNPTTCFRSHLSEEYEWFVTTPVEIRLEHGIVMTVTTNLDEFSALSGTPTRIRRHRLANAIEMPKGTSSHGRETDSTGR